MSAEGTAGGASPAGAAGAAGASGSTAAAADRNRLTHPQGAFGAVLALGLSGLKGIWQSKLVWIAVGFSAVHVGIRVAVVVFASLFVPELLPTVLDPDFLADTIRLQAVLPVVVVLGTVGARVTARDRMMGGLEFILSKAIPSWGYVAGRSLAPLLATTLLVLLPVLLLAFLLATMVDNAPPGTGDMLWGAIGLATLVTLVLGPLAAGLGTLVDNPRSATGLWLALVWATLPLSGMAAGLGADWWWAVSPIVTLVATGGTLMGIPFPAGSEEALGWLASLVILIVPLGLLWWRTREVYG